MSWIDRVFRKKNKIKLVEPKKPKEYVPLQRYTRRFGGETHTFNLGDRVICRSNECDPLWDGHIVEFWDNDGKWITAIPQVKNKDGKIFGVMGVIKPYSEELLNELKDLKPLEQWNYLVPEEFRYSDEVIKKKENSYKNRAKNVKQL